MRKTVKNLLNILDQEVGYCEKDTNANLDSKNASNDGYNDYTKYARDLAEAGYYQASKQGYAWCDVFVDWCFLQLAGNKADAEAMQCQTGLYGAGCNWSARYYEEQGRLFTSNPQVGDQIFFGDYEHTGVIEKISDGKIYTVEGNSGDMVQRNIYAMDNPYITAFGRPFYEEEPEPEVVVPSNEIKAGDVVSIENGAVWYNGFEIPNWVMECKWVVLSVDGDRAVIDASEDGSHSIMSPIDIKYLNLVDSVIEDKPIVGDLVIMSRDAYIYDSEYKFDDWVYDSDLYLRELSDNRAVISTQETGAVTGAVDIKYLRKA